MVTINGAKGDPCTECGMQRAQFIIAKSSTELVYVCSFCEVGLANKSEPTDTVNRTADRELD